MKIGCRGFDRAGKPVAETVEAGCEADAAEILRRRGIFVTEFVVGTDEDLAKEGDAGRSGPLGGRTRRMREVSSFMRQLAVLIRTGTPLVEAMESLERQTPAGKWRDVIEEVRGKVEEGSTLSAALEPHPEYFDAICRSLVAAGESGGKLEPMLDRLSKLTRQQVKVRQSIAGAMVYPLLLVFVSFAVINAMLLFVMPRFEGLFKSLDTPLPPTTQILMELSAFIRAEWYFVLGGAIAAATGVFFYLRSAAGRQMIDVGLVRLPQLGRVTRSFATARIARVLGVLLEGRVPLLEALALTKQATGNSLYAALIKRAEDTVVRGENVSAAFADATLVNPSVCEAIRSGERTGQIAPVLLSVADYLDEDNEVLIRSLTSIIEPLILIGLGLIVGGMAISMFLPLFDLTAAAAGPGGPGGGS